MVSSEWEPRPASNNAAPEELAEEAGQPRMKLLVPAYFYPAGPGLKHWEQLIDAAAHVPIVAVANPGSGPGEDLNPDYRTVVGRASRRGVTVIGYIGTNYAHRPRLEVEADVDRWIRFYPEIQGIFFDAQASDVGHVDDYAILREFVRKKINRALVVTNPGTLCAKNTRPARPRTSSAYSNPPRDSNTSASPAGPTVTPRGTSPRCRTTSRARNR